jgi:4-alpha-glucanotransferase
MMTRSSGILLHISSLPSIAGIGDFGPAAYEFADFLSASKQKFWQILPLNPTDAVYGNCPYSSPSAFALNTLFISPELLVKDGLLKKDEVNALKPPSQLERVEYLTVIEQKNRLYDQAFARFKNTAMEKGAFTAFCKKENDWLDPYAFFVLFKKRFDGKIWSDWPEDIRERRKDILKEFAAKFSDDIKKIKFLQFIAFKQWHELREYLHSKDLAFIGDIPIYVNEDSADVWANPQIFKLDEKLKPIVVAGVPPDYFSQTGQRWGNPVYDWDRLKKTDYQWWMKRVRHNLELFDTIRIDHFRGLMGYWEIPVAEQTAINGHWEKGPGEDFLSHLQKTFPDLSLIAEDLGLITPDVTAAMHKFNLPGMKVLHFAFSGDPQHPYLPANYPESCVVYSGTHDNNTSKGWFRKDAAPHEKDFLQKYLQQHIDENNVSQALIKMAYSSRAVLALVPMQDVLNLDEKSRMNIPGTVYHNWEWRFKHEDLAPAHTLQLAQITENTQR